MRLLIDIGNTNTSLALVEGERILKSYFIHTSKEEVSVRAFRRLLGKSLKRIDEILVVSVVPKFLSLVKARLKSIMPKVSVAVVGEDIKVPIKVKYKDPEEVGQDRLVTAYGAICLYGSPVLVIDFGTAVTFDFVNDKKEYEGGLIFPGLRLALEALVSNAALLPDIEIKAPKGFIGRDTEGSMNKGFVFGYAAMCDGMVKMFRDKYGKKLKVVATGGVAGLIAKYSKFLDNVYPVLIFKGLQDLPK